MEEFLKRDYEKLYNSYFNSLNSDSTVYQGYFGLDEYDDYMEEFKYLDEEKTKPVGKEIKDHLYLASMSSTYKTVM